MSGIGWILATFQAAVETDPIPRPEGLGFVLASFQPAKINHHLDVDTQLNYILVKGNARLRRYLDPANQRIQRDMVPFPGAGEPEGVA